MADYEDLIKRLRKKIADLESIRNLERAEHAAIRERVIVAEAALEEARAEAERLYKEGRHEQGEHERWKRRARAAEAERDEARRERDRLAYELLARVGLPFVDPSAVAASDEHLCDRAGQIRDVVEAAEQVAIAVGMGWDKDGVLDNLCAAVRALKQENENGSR